MITVSIITPSYNSSRFISSTLSSVLDQSFEDWELIVIDDCSTDNSIDIVQSFSDQDPRIKLIQLAENSGAAVARNSGIQAAQGRYITFLDSDDLWFPDKLQTQVLYMQDKDVAFSYSAYEKIDEHGHSIGVMGVPDKVTYTKLLKCCVIGCLTAMYDTQKLGKVYMPLIRKRQDFGLWLRLLKKTDYAYGIKKSLAQYRIRTGSISSKKSSAASYTWQLFREVEQLGILKSSYYFTHYAVHGVLRQKFPRFAKKIGFLD